jgi:hypothetical protein
MKLGASLLSKRRKKNKDLDLHKLSSQRHSSRSNLCKGNTNHHSVSELDV